MEQLVPRYLPGSENNVWLVQSTILCMDLTPGTTFKNRDFVIGVATNIGGFYGENRFLLPGSYCAILPRQSKLLLVTESEGSGERDVNFGNTFFCTPTGEMYGRSDGYSDWKVSGLRVSRSFIFDSGQVRINIERGNETWVPVKSTEFSSFKLVLDYQDSFNQGEAAANFLRSSGLKVEVIVY